MKTNKKLKISIVCKNVVKYFVTVALLILFRQKGKKKKKKKKQTNKQTETKILQFDPLNVSEFIKG